MPARRGASSPTSSSTRGSQPARARPRAELRQARSFGARRRRPSLLRGSRRGALRPARDERGGGSARSPRAALPAAADSAFSSRPQRLRGFVALRSLPRMTLPAVVIAAGLGSRLRPLTERYAKPLLPIDGKPVLGPAPARARRRRLSARDARDRPPRRAGRALRRRRQRRSASRSRRHGRQVRTDRLTRSSRRKRTRRTSWSVPTPSSTAARSSGSPSRLRAPALPVRWRSAVATRTRRDRNGIGVDDGRVERLHDPEGAVRGGTALGGRRSAAPPRWRAFRGRRRTSSRPRFSGRSTRESEWRQSRSARRAT